jgi:hypothetical protein
MKKALNILDVIAISFIVICVVAVIVVFSDHAEQRGIFRDNAKRPSQSSPSSFGSEDQLFYSDTLSYLGALRDESLVAQQAMVHGSDLPSIGAGLR